MKTPPVKLIHLVYVLLIASTALVAWDGVQNWRKETPAETLFPVDGVNAASVIALRDANTDWILSHMHQNGSLPYMTPRPPHGPRNQLSRQWLASRALAEMAAQGNDPAIIKSLLQNVHYNLSRYLVTQDDYAYFSAGGQRGYLAANAIAASALAIAKRYDESLTAPYEKIVKGILHYWQDDGQFTTTIGPDDETQEVSSILASGFSLQILAREAGSLKIAPESLHKSFMVYYTRWQRERSLYDVAPLIMAGADIYDISAEDSRPALSAAVYDMANTLVNCQNRNPKNIAHYGAYSRSGCNAATNSTVSTGMRLEGVLAAYDLARKQRNTSLIKTYQRSAHLGLRLLMQRQGENPDASLSSSPTKAWFAPRETHVRIDTPAYVVLATQKANILLFSSKLTENPVP